MRNRAEVALEEAGLRGGASGGAAGVFVNDTTATAPAVRKNRPRSEEKPRNIEGLRDKCIIAQKGRQDRPDRTEAPQKGKAGWGGPPGQGEGRKRVLVEPEQDNYMS